ELAEHELQTIGGSVDFVLHGLADQIGRGNGGRILGLEFGPVRQYDCNQRHQPCRIANSSARGHNQSDHRKLDEEVCCFVVRRLLGQWPTVYTAFALYYLLNLMAREAVLYIFSAPGRFSEPAGFV